MQCVTRLPASVEGHILASQRMRLQSLGSASRGCRHMHRCISSTSAFPHCKYTLYAQHGRLHSQQHCFRAATSAVLNTCTQQHYCQCTLGSSNSFSLHRSDRHLTCYQWCSGCNVCQRQCAAKTQQAPSLGPVTSTNWASQYNETQRLPLSKNSVSS